MSVRSLIGVLLAGSFFWIASVAVAGEGAAETAAKRLVAEALQAEAAGDAMRHETLLRDAVAAAPDFSPARWHRGELLVGGEWKPIEDAQAAAAADPARVEYQVLREGAGAELNDQLVLARWCEKHQLQDEARCHWTNAIAIQPFHEEALHALGACWHQGQLMTYADAKAAKAQSYALKKAAQEAKPTLARWIRMFEAGDVRSRNDALEKIRTTDDRVALAALEEMTLDPTLGSNAEFEQSMSFGMALIAALERMPDQAATDSLLRHAAVAPIRSIRAAAATALQNRSPHGYVPQLLSLLSMPFESSFRMTSDDAGGVHYWHLLYREGRDSNLSIESRSSLIQQDFDGETAFVGNDGESIVAKESLATIAARMARNANRSRANYTNAALSTEQQVAQLNSQIATMNTRVATLLCNVTDQNLGADPRAWWNWWDEYNEYSTEGETPTYERRYVDTQLEYHRMPGYAPLRHSCFAAGTMVWTKTGLRPIETLEMGDLVLAQNIESGELSYQTVMGRTIRPDRPTLVVRCGSESIQATLGHPIWVAGNGWKMAKELKPGDVLHGVSGPVLVDSVESADAIDVFNLIVADAHNYFVGEAGVLVHDNSPRQPTTVVVPGLARN